MLIFFMTFFISLSAYAVPITLTFQGKITENYSGQSEFEVGTTFNLSLIYDNVFNTDLNPDNNAGAYHSMFQRLDILMTFSTDTSIQSSIDDNRETLASIDIENNYMGNDFDKFAFQTNNAAVGEFNYSTWMYENYCTLSFNLIDSSGDVFINDLLPEDLNLHEFDPDSLFINSSLFQGTFIASPEPMTILLMGTGVFGFVFSRKREKK